MDQKFIILPEDVNKGNTKDLRRSSNAIIKIGNYFRQSSEVCRRSRDILITLILQFLLEFGPSLLSTLPPAQPLKVKATSTGHFKVFCKSGIFSFLMVSPQTRAAS